MLRLSCLACALNDGFGARFARFFAYGLPILCLVFFPTKFWASGTNRGRQGWLVASRSAVALAIKLHSRHSHAMRQGNLRSSGARLRSAWQLAGDSLTSRLDVAIDWTVSIHESIRATASI